MICPPLWEAERRFCAVSIPAWMPEEPCWARDGPSRRAHGAGPERGNLSEAKAVRWGGQINNKPTEAANRPACFV